MSDAMKDIERLADINDHLRRQLDKSNEIVVELNHMVAKQAGEIATLRAQLDECAKENAMLSDAVNYDASRGHDR